MLDGEYNDVRAWDFCAVTKLVGAGEAYSARTEDEFARALGRAIDEKEKIALIHVHLAQDDFSPGLVRLTTNLRTRV